MQKWKWMTFLVVVEKLDEVGLRRLKLRGQKRRKR